MYYYKLNPEITSLSQMHVGTNLNMEYMMHPDFVIKLDTPNHTGTFTYHGWTLSTLDFHEIAEFEVKQYIDFFYDDLLIVVDQFNITGYMDDVKYEGYYLYDLTFESAENPTPSEPQIQWSSTRSYSINFVDTYLKEQIRSRYAFLDRPRDGSKHVILDTFLPRLLYKYGFSDPINYTELRRNLPKTGIAISPFTANLLNVPQIPIDQLCQVLGYDKVTIGKLLRKVKSKSLTFIFVGAGGTNINTAHWLTQLSEMCHVTGLFKEVYVFEKDKAELSNLLRFPKDPNSILGSHSYKLNIIREDAYKLSRKTPEFSRYFIPDSNGNYPSSIYNHTDFVSGTQTDEGVWIAGHYKTIELANPESTILYGAPSIETRDALSKYGNFLCATHADTSCSIYLNPNHGQDLNIQVESYGMIQLGSFFMNQLKLAISTIEILSADDLDLTEQDKPLLDFSFDGTIEGTTDKQYKWQISQSATMLTEQESTNF